MGGLRGGHAHPLRRGPAHPPAGRLLPRPRGLGPQPHPGGAAPAPAPLPPARHLPLPGAQAGRRRARAVPPGQPLHRPGEAQGLRVLRPDHHRRLDPVGGRAVRRRGRGRLPRGGVRLLPRRPLRRPRQPARQHRRRPARRLHRRRVVGAGQRLRWDARPRRAAVLRPPPARRLAVPDLPDHLARHADAGHPDPDLAGLRRRGGRAAGAGGGAGHDARRRRPRAARHPAGRARATDPRHPRQPPQTGGTRADGSRITAGVPSAIPLEGEELPDAGSVDPSHAEPIAIGPD